MIAILSIFCEISLSWMPQDLTDDYAVSAGSGKWIGAVRQQAITWTCADQILWSHRATMS